jgi:transposase
MPGLLAKAEEKFSGRMFRLLKLIVDEWKEIEADITQLDQEIEQIAKDDLSCQRLLKVPGVGPLTATAIVAAIGNGAAFTKADSSRHGSGLCPGKSRLAGSPSCSVSASKVMNTSGGCSYTELARWWHG